MDTGTRTDVFDEVVDLIRGVLDGYDPGSEPVTRETRFQQDLAFESIDIVVLGTRLTERYGPAVDFPAFLSTLTIEEIIALSVGDLVDHVSAALCRS
jgi:acyl carrier protein